MKTVHVVITGRVQGVSYRYWTKREAIRRSLNGWVRNRSDGSVEAMFSGNDAEVDAMVAACKQGPSFAKVTDVGVSEVANAEVAEGFDIVG